MRIDTWTSGYKVEACDWYDGKHIYFDVQSFKPGASISRPPDLERSILIRARCTKSSSLQTALPAQLWEIPKNLWENPLSRFWQNTGTAKKQ